MNSDNSSAETNSHRLSNQIAKIFSNQSQSQTISLESFLSLIQTKSFGVLLVITALPIAMPFTPPGVGIPFGLMCIFLSLQMLIGRTSPWFPKWLLNQKIGTSSSKLTDLMIRCLKWFEFFLKPRFSFLVTSKLAKSVLACLILFCAVIMLIPLPLVNSLSALPIFLLGISLVEEDGLFAIFGILSALFLIGLVIATAILGVGFLEIIKNWVLTLLGRN